MIENIILKYLKQDDTLDDLTAGHIYPDVGQVKALPCERRPTDKPERQPLGLFPKHNI